MNQDQIRSLIDRCTISFEEREDLMYEGLQIYLAKRFAEYFDQEQLEKLAKMLKRFRIRPKDISYSSDLVEVISAEKIIANRFIPRRAMRKDELAIVLYNICPYALLGRFQTAMLAKDAFPNFFSSPATVNSTFTKYTNIPGSILEKEILGLTPTFPEHTVESVELILFELAKNFGNHSNKE